MRAARSTIRSIAIWQNIRGLSLLDAKQERALAREIDALEVEHWRALLSRRDALDVVAAVVDRVLPEGGRVLHELRQAEAAPRGRRGRRAASRTARRARALDAAANRLQRLDMDGSALHAADLAVREAGAGRSAASAQLARIARARQAQQRAKERFVTANLRLVIAMARRYDRGRLPLADSIQEGNLGLMHAVERFDYRRGYRFSTYASWWIRHSLNRALSDKGRLIRVPVHALDDMSRITRAAEAEAVKSGSAPDAEGIALRTGLGQDKVQMLVAGWSRDPISLDRHARPRLRADAARCPGRAGTAGPGRVAGRRPLGPPAPPAPAAPVADSSPLSCATASDSTERRSSRCASIGEKHALSRERIRQIQQEALVKLRRIAATMARRGATERGRERFAP